MDIILNAVLVDEQVTMCETNHYCNFLLLC